MNHFRVAVMGCTGSGKSTFVRRVTGAEDIRIGDELDSCTDKVESYSLAADGNTVDVLDTPGFDDSSRTEAEIFAEIANYLQGLPDSDKQMSGIVYLHPAARNKMTGSSMRNLQLLKALCGEDFYPSVILAISIWDKEDPDTLHARKDELVKNDEFWADMLSKGSQCVLLPNSKEDGINMILELTRRQSSVLQFQTELNQGATVESTTAAQFVQHADELKQITEEGERRLAEEEERRQAMLEEMNETEEYNQKDAEREIKRIEQAERRDRRRAKVKLAFKAFGHQMRIFGAKIQYFADTMNARTWD